jgi:hypothetical protein
MAELSITISNTLKVKPATEGDSLSLWGTFVWGTDPWYGDFDTSFELEKHIGNTVTATQSMGKNVDKGLSETVTVTQTMGVELTKVISNTISLSTAITPVVTQGDWIRDEPDLADWTEVDDGDTTWTPASTAGTDWDDA